MGKDRGGDGAIGGGGGGRGGGIFLYSFCFVCFFLSDMAEPKVLRSLIRGYTDLFSW